MSPVETMLTLRATCGNIVSMTKTETKTIGEQMKGVRKGQRIAIHGPWLGGSVDPLTHRVTYVGRRNGRIVVEGRTADPIFIDPAASGTVER